MKQVCFTYLALITLTACNTKVKDQKEKTVIISETKTDISVANIDTIDMSSSSELMLDRECSIAFDFKKFRIYNLTDTIRADFNGDKTIDFAFFTQKNNGEIFIVDGKSHFKSKIGLDKSFHDMGSRFDWVDFWGTTDDNETFEIVFKNNEINDAKKTQLNHTSLFVRKDEIGGGVITYKNGEYIWIHQSD